MSLLGLPLSPASGNAQSAAPKESPHGTFNVSVVHVDASGRLVRVARQARKVQPPRRPKPAANIASLVNEAAKRYEVDPLLVNSLIRIESASDQTARSPKGAEGLMQLVPHTARRFGVADSFDPKQNIEGGVRYLKYLQGLFPTDLTLSIAAYNAGEGAVAKYKTVPPYRETLGYVQKVTEQYGRMLEAQQLSDGVVETQRHVETVLDAEGRLYLRTR